jgi:hypothetical protein
MGFPKGNFQNFGDTEIIIDQSKMKVVVFIAKFFLLFQFSKKYFRSKIN